MQVSSTPAATTPPVGRAPALTVYSRTGPGPATELDEAGIAADPVVASGVRTVHDFRDYLAQHGATTLADRLDGTILLDDHTMIDGAIRDGELLTFGRGKEVLRGAVLAQPEVVAHELTHRVSAARPGDIATREAIADLVATGFARATHVAGSDDWRFAESAFNQGTAAGRDQTRDLEHPKLPTAAHVDRYVRSLRPGQLPSDYRTGGPLTAAYAAAARSLGGDEHLRPVLLDVAAEPGSTTGPLVAPASQELAHMPRPALARLVRGQLEDVAARFAARAGDRYGAASPEATAVASALRAVGLLERPLPA